MKNVSHQVGKRIAEVTTTAAIKAFRLAVEVAVQDAHAQVWTRGAYPLGLWRPFDSPVDFTVWFAKEPSSRDLLAVRRNYERLRKVLPFLMNGGSLNLYVATEAPLFSGIANPFELERDPQLKKKLNPTSEIHPRAHAATFLFRTLEKDLIDVMESPSRLQPRWDQQLLQVGQVLDDSAFEEWQSMKDCGLLRQTINLAVRVLDVPKDDRDEIADCLELYYQSVAKEVPIYTLRPLIEREPYLWAVFPHRFCFKSVEPPQLTGILAELALAEVSWELSDMLAKARLYPIQEQMRASARSHLDSLQEFYDRFLCSKGVVTPATRHGIETAAKRIRTLL